jgi:SAM-dependent methyltransferase
MATLPYARTSFAELYDQALVGPLFRPFAGPLLDELELAAGDRVLDVACGTGLVARLAKERLGETGKVVGVDLGPGMIAAARRLAPDVEWREGDAAALPLNDDERFDAVACQQGLQFFPDRAAAARERHRALAPGGRLAMSAWRSDEEMPFIRELRRVAEGQLGPTSDLRHSFGDAGALEALLRDAGFVEVRSKVVARTICFEDPAVFVRLNAMALISMSAAAKAMDDEERERAVATIARDSAGAAQPYTDEKGLAFELITNVTTARK